jgi:hypothetical protein
MITACYVFAPLAMFAIVAMFAKIAMFAGGVPLKFFPP